MWHCAAIKLMLTLGNSLTRKGTMITDPIATDAAPRRIYRNTNAATSEDGADARFVRRMVKEHQFSTLQSRLLSAYSTRFVEQVDQHTTSDKATSELKSDMSRKVGAVSKSASIVNNPAIPAFTFSSSIPRIHVVDLNHSTSCKSSL